MKPQNKDTDMTALKIVKLTAENIKALKAVEITPDDNFVQITGKNGAGKSSVLDSILWAIGGGDAIQAKPIRAGETKGRIELDLGDMIVERRFTEGGTTLAVKNKDGLKFPSPQALLDGLVGKVAFDPHQFLRMRPDQQAATLKELAGLDFTALDAKARQAYDERTIVNRDAKSLRAQAAGIVVPPDAPGSEVDAGEIIAEISAATAHNAKCDELARAHAIAGNALHDAEQDHANAVKILAKARADLASAEDVLAKAKAALSEAAEKSAAVERQDTEPLQAKLSNLNAVNAAARKRKDRARLEADAKAKEAEAEALTKALAEIDAAKEAQIKAAKLPLDGLGYDGARVTFGGLPLDQASHAEQLRVSVAMAMAMNPKLRVLRITDGSLLDSASMAIIREMADGQDYQVWIECATDGQDIGVVIEDGAVKTKPAPEAVTPTMEAAE